MVGSMAMKKNPNIRWWEYIHNGWVKLTLKPGQIIHHHYSAPDEEGYSFTSCRWDYMDDGILTRKITYGGRDCDGYIENRHTSLCSVDELSVCPAYQNPIISSSKWERSLQILGDYHLGRLIHRPAWREGKSSVYDQEAQRAGY